MYLSNNFDQVSFMDCLHLSAGKLFGDNRYIKVHKLIQRDQLDNHYASHLCNGFVLPAKPFRMAHWGYIIKAYLSLTDDALVQ